MLFLKNFVTTDRLLIVTLVGMLGRQQKWLMQWKVVLRYSIVVLTFFGDTLHTWNSLVPQQRDSSTWPELQKQFLWFHTVMQRKSAFSALFAKTKLTVVPVSALMAPCLTFWPWSWLIQKKWHLAISFVLVMIYYMNHQRKLHHLTTGNTNKRFK